MGTFVKNIPEYARDHRYIVARFVDGEWWFWGAYDVMSEAADAACQIGGEWFSEVVREGV